jgi:GT2 family glycosyltransferase
VDPRLSVVIPVYDNWWLTARALGALDALRDETLPFETIVVDNASSDETPEGMRAFPWVRYQRLERNTNFAGACNAGARAAQTPLVLFLNNDACPLGDALTPLAAAFDRPEVAVAGAALFFEDGTTQCAGFVLLPNAHWHYSYRNLPPSLPGVVNSRDALAVSGAAMAVRTQWFLEAGGFDETFVNGFEDVDLCMRASEGGRAIAYVAESRFAHYEAASARRYAREAENEAQFYARWSPRLAALPRTERGGVGAIAVRVADSSALGTAALEDLETALRDLGHPIVRGGVRSWQRLDARFRASATLGWFAADAAAPSVTVEGDGTAPAVLRAHGASDACVPWLPCANADRAAALPLRFDPVCETVAVAGFDTAPRERRRDLVAALDAIALRRETMRIVVLTHDASENELKRRFGDRADCASLLAAGAGRLATAAVVHAGFTDPAAFGNVLLAQAELPSIVVNDDLRALLAPDVTTYAVDGNSTAAIDRVLGDPELRARNARLGAADARRRFSPRRSAIRVIDLLCAARFGLERPAPARTNSPLAR